MALKIRVDGSLFEKVGAMMNSIKAIPQQGFTLIELMVVVGIIGILVSIAAPNFQRYQSKARQSEAKIALSAIYSGEKAFYAEYNAHIGDLGAIGYTPEGIKRMYTIGWTAVWAGSVTGFPTLGTTVGSFARTGYPSTWTACVPVLSATPATNATDSQTFTTIASGQIRNSQNCDVWSVNETKTISNVTISL